MEINDLDIEIHIPPFHSRSIMTGRSATFDIELTNLNVDKTKLVSTV
jgi:hypothetical protein